MEITASLVKKLRDETDAPMMECKKALVEAQGDFDKAKEVLRERGKAVAAKKAGRETSQGIAIFVTSPDAKSAAGVVVECETDFVARNQDFIAMVKSVAQAVLDNPCGCSGVCTIEKPLEVKAGDTTIGGVLEASIAVIRENIQLRKAVCAKTDKQFAVYNHHDLKKAALVEIEGTATNLGEIGNKTATQVIAFQPRYVRREEVSKDVIDHEIEIEAARAVNEGKPEAQAAKIAQGRVQKEFFQTQVLLEQIYWENPKEKTSDAIAALAKAGNGTANVVGFTRIAVGEE